MQARTIIARLYNERAVLEQKAHRRWDIGFVGFGSMQVRAARRGALERKSHHWLGVRATSGLWVLYRADGASLAGWQGSQVCMISTGGWSAGFQAW